MLNGHHAFISMSWMREDSFMRPGEAVPEIEFSFDWLSVALFPSRPDSGSSCPGLLLDVYLAH